MGLVARASDWYSEGLGFESQFFFWGFNFHLSVSLSITYACSILRHKHPSVFFQLLATTRVPRGSHRQMNLKDSLFFFKEEGEGEIGGSGWD